MSGGKCLCCLTVNQLKNLSKNEWDMCDFMFQPFIQNYPDVYKNSDVKLCNSCFTSVQCVDKFRRSALQNFLKLMSMLYQDINPIKEEKNNLMPTVVKQEENIEDLQIAISENTDNLLSTEIKEEKNEEQLEVDISGETDNLISEMKEEDNDENVEIEISEKMITAPVMNNATAEHSSSPNNYVKANPVMVKPTLNSLLVVPNAMLVTPNSQMTAPYSSLGITNPTAATLRLGLNATMITNIPKFVATKLKLVAPNPNLAATNPNLLAPNPNLAALNPRLVAPNPKLVAPNPTLTPSPSSAPDSFTSLLAALLSKPSASVPKKPNITQPNTNIRIVPKPSTTLTTESANVEARQTYVTFTSTEVEKNYEYIGHLQPTDRMFKRARSKATKSLENILIEENIPVQGRQIVRNYTWKRTGVEDGPQYCKPCGRTLKNVHALRRHNSMKHKGERKYCEECDKWFSEGSFRMHLKMSKVHKKDKDEFICDYCGGRFGNRPAITTHIFSKHLNIKSYKCPKCPKTYFSRSAMNRHIAVNHKKWQPARTHICEVCGAGFQTGQLLSAHMVTHTGARPYSCDICGDTSGSSEALYTHKKLKHKVKHRKTPGQEENIAEEDNKDIAIEDEKSTVKEVDTVAAVKES